MAAVVVEVPGHGHRAICEDEACATTTPLRTARGQAYTLTTPWRTWVWEDPARVRSLAADHNRARHGGAQ